MNPIFKGKVTKGKFQPFNPDKFKTHVASFEGKFVDVTIKGQTKKRSNNQNAYMWAVVYKLIADDTGYSTDDIHDLMRQKFWFRMVGDEKCARSTQKMKKSDMEEYLSNIRQWASVNINCYIPLPNEVEYE